MRAQRATAATPSPTLEGYRDKKTKRASERSGVREEENHDRDEKDESEQHQEAMLRGDVLFVQKILKAGINVDRVPGPRGPVTYRDLYLRQYRVVGDGTQSR